jgi:hypothetical protein
MGKAFKANPVKTFFDAVANGKLVSGELLKGVANTQALSDSAWAREIEFANRNYKPGTFTTFIAYEWSSMPDGQNLHRNVIFRTDKAPHPFSSIDSKKPEDLWAWLDKIRGEGYEALAIPHNSNASNGLMFDWNDSNGRPIDQAYAEERASNEPLVEIAQNKGASETHPVLSPNDEFANYEFYDHLLISQKKSQPEGSYVRDALGRGLEIAERTQGVNPFRRRERLPQRPIDLERGCLCRHHRRHRSHPPTAEPQGLPQGLCGGTQGSRCECLRDERRQPHGRLG